MSENSSSCSVMGRGPLFAIALHPVGVRNPALVFLDQFDVALVDKRVLQKAPRALRNVDDLREQGERECLAVQVCDCFPGRNHSLLGNASTSRPRAGVLRDLETEDRTLPVRTGNTADLSRVTASAKNLHRGVSGRV